MRNNRPHSRSDFELAIICALPLERDAVGVLLDEEYETDNQSYGKAVGDQNVYTTGRLGNQSVVIAHMPGTGTVSAAAVAANLCSSFDRIKAAFVVGICGGVPTATRNGEKNDIFLGDVIVSTSVVQIDFGRQYPHGFESKRDVEDILGRNSRELRSFGDKLSTRLCQTRLQNKTYSYATQISWEKGFSSSAYPGPEHDILYPAEYRHKHQNSGCKICNLCTANEDEVCAAASTSSCDSLGCSGASSQNRIQRQSAAQGDSTEDPLQATHQPAIHFGRMACGNQVIKSGIYRTRISEKEKVIGFEMESAGTWDSVPTIVVKGVCDYADSHKNKKWQAYAAATAAACTKAILEEWRNADRPDQNKLIYPVHNTIIRPGNTDFTGRQDVLSDLTTIIQEAVKNKSQPTPCHIVISGMGGLGKSEICLQLARQLANHFWGIFWIDVSTTTQAENGILNIANRLGMEKASWATVQQRLINIQKPWLLVLDNADDPETDYQQYLPASTFGIVLLTSRNDACGQHATQRHIIVEGLAESDAVELLFRTARMTGSQQKVLAADAGLIARLLRAHPLALIQAASYIGRGHCSFKDYPSVYMHHRERLMAFRPNQARSRYQDVYATFEASAEKLQQMATLPAMDALTLFSVLAIYGLERLPVTMFEAAWHVGNSVSDVTSQCSDPLPILREVSAEFGFDTTSGGRKISVLTDDVKVADNSLFTLTMWHRQMLPAFVQVDRGQWDSYRLVEALNLLRAFSLVSLVSTDAQIPSLNVSIHPLVHAWARDRMNPEQQHTYWVQAACIMAFSRSRPEFWYNHEAVLRPHIQAVASVSSWPMKVMLGQDSAIEISRILVNCSLLLCQVSDHQVALEVLREFLTHLNSKHQDPNKQWLDIYYLTGMCLRNLGRYGEAVTLLEQSAEIRQELPVLGHPNEVNVYFELARAYLDNKQVSQGILLLEQIIAIDDERLVLEQPYLLSPRSVLATAYVDNGRAQEAISLLEPMVNLTSWFYAPEHPDRLDWQCELAMAYLNNGRALDAVSLLENIVQIRNRILPLGHTARYTSQKKLFTAYCTNSQPESAMKLFTQLSKDYEHIETPGSPPWISSQHEIAVSFWTAGDIEEAITLMRKVVNMTGNSRIRGGDVWTASRRHLAMWLWDSERKDDALRLVRGVIDSYEGTPDEASEERISAQKCLVEWLWEHEHRDAAVGLMQQVVGLERSSFSDDDPRLIPSLDILSNFLWEQGDRARAIAHMREIARIAEHRSGGDDPAVVELKESIDEMEAESNT